MRAQQVVLQELHVTRGRWATWCLRVCAPTTKQVDFGEPSKRNYLLSSSHGTFSVPKNDCEDAWW